MASQTRVLVVDDEEGIREVVSRILERLGHDVVTAHSAQQALEILGEAGTAFSLAVVDRSMPEMDGVALIQRMEGAWPGVKVLLISGHDPQDVPFPPHVAFLHKPFLPDELRHKVHKLLEA